jgi:phage terminase small subunit
MGKRGPQPTPTAQLAQRGSWRAKTRTQEPDADPLTEAPACPQGLTGDAAAVWQVEAPRMVGNGTLTAGDLQAFERYCRTFALWRKKANALESADDFGESAVKALTHLENALRKLEAAFGKSPADRANLKVPEKPKPNASDPFQKPQIVRSA